MSGLGWVSFRVSLQAGVQGTVDAEGPSHRLIWQSGERQITITAGTMASGFSSLMTEPPREPGQQVRSKVRLGTAAQFKKGWEGPFEIQADRGEPG